MHFRKTYADGLGHTGHFRLLRAVQYNGLLKTKLQFGNALLRLADLLLQRGDCLAPGCSCQGRQRGGATMPMGELLLTRLHVSHTALLQLYTLALSTP